MKGLDLRPRPQRNVAVFTRGHSQSICILEKYSKFKTLKIFHKNKGKLSPGLQHLAVPPAAAAAVGQHQPPPVESVRIRPAGSWQIPAGDLWAGQPSFQTDLQINYLVKTNSSCMESFYSAIRIWVWILSYSIIKKCTCEKNRYLLNLMQLEFTGF